MKIFNYLGAALFLIASLIAVSCEDVADEFIYVTHSDASSITGNTEESFDLKYYYNKKTKITSMEFAGFANVYLTKRDVKEIMSIEDEAPEIEIKAKVKMDGDTSVVTSVYFRPIFGAIFINSDLWVDEYNGISLVLISEELNSNLEKAMHVK